MSEGYHKDAVKLLLSFSTFCTLSLTTVYLRHKRYASQTITTAASKNCELLCFEQEMGRLTKERVREMRKEYFCSAQSVSYAANGGLMIVKGKGQYLYDELGNEYLDTRNNVAHVGWQHPKVVGAIARQLSQTNSNTRYLHPAPVLLARELLATLPSSLEVCFFTNSGSEANELALRLATASSGCNSSTIVVERGYHGNTTGTVALSPYKFNGKGGAGKPDNIEVISCPDVFRSRGNESVLKSLTQVKQACERIKSKNGRKVKGVFIESGMSVAGVVLPPDGYLQSMFEIVRSYGGVCVCDEVQVGFGRFGSHFWGFQQQGVVPDIVTMGKPFGNGYPLGCVVCTRNIAEKFTNGMEYFNTFGGNPAACVAGLAVLETIKTENLQENAKQVGNYIRRELSVLKDCKDGKLIGDVRGSGLFIGIEFVRDRCTLEPATEETKWICDQLMKSRILTSIDGPFDSVMVMKPPLCFSHQNATNFIHELRNVLVRLNETKQCV